MRMLQLVLTQQRPEGWGWGLEEEGSRRSRASPSGGFGFVGEIRWAGCRLLQVAHIARLRVTARR